MAKKKKKEESTHVYPRKEVFFRNYDLYGPEDGSETSPGMGLYGDMGAKKKKYKSIANFRKKKQEARKKRKKALAALYARIAPKEVVKLAVIRNDSDTKCPFGLSVPEACCNVGDSILHMTPMEDPDDLGSVDTVEENRELYKTLQNGKKCPFAREVFEESVQCDFTVDTQKHPPVGSPYYYRHFNHETSLDGLYSYPHHSGSLGYYSETAIPTNNYYGPYSIESISSDEDERKK